MMTLPHLLHIALGLRIGLENPERARGRADIFYFLVFCTRYHFSDIALVCRLKMKQLNSSNYQNVSYSIQHGLGPNNHLLNINEYIIKSFNNVQLNLSDRTMILIC